MRWRISATLLALLLSASPALADDVGGKLSAYEAEAKSLGVKLPQPSGLVSEPR